jgi:hypothetical protein
MREAHGTYQAEQLPTGFWWGNLNERKNVCVCYFTAFSTAKVIQCLQRMKMENWWNDADRGKQNRSARIKSCSKATLSIKNPTKTGAGLNRDLRVGNVAFNRVRHGTALKEIDRPDVDDRILKKKDSRAWRARDRDQQRALLNTAMKLGFLKMRAIF